MKKVLFLSTLFVTGAAFSYKATIGGAAINEKAPTADSIVKGKKITVYTTALGTNQRLSQTETLNFKDFGQPLETQPCIFIDPARTFQTFMGMDGRQSGRNQGPPPFNNDLYNISFLAVRR